MEKRAAHYDLAQVQSIVTKRGVDAFTRTALMGLDAMALTQAQGLQVVLALQRSMLFKSMSTHDQLRTELVRFA